MSLELNAFVYLVATIWQQKSNSVCFTDNTNNVDTLC